MNNYLKYFSLIITIFCLFSLSCHKTEELSLDEYNAFTAEGVSQILAKTVSKPWLGQEFVPGKRGGSWNSVISDDPKSFNLLIAEQDSATSTVVGSMHDYLLDYDVIKREWVSHAASAQTRINESAGTMSVIFTLRDDLYWSYYNSDRKVKVTSDDVIFWYNEIEGDPDMQSSGYYGQFLTMPDGSEERITIHRIDELSFLFHFPRIIAEPYLMTNRDFGPRHIYEPVKRRGGPDAVRSHFSVAVDPKIIPSMGEWFLVEYTPGQRLVYKRNPNYWRRDSKGFSIPYLEENIVRIIPDENTKLLLFLRGETDSYGLRPEDLDALVNKGSGNYTVFNSEGGLGAAFWTFNQNPVNSGKPCYEWFTQKEFRQAMSCFLNRDRLNAQVYRGLAQPKLNIFPEPNPFYNPSIQLQYIYDVKRGEELLSRIGIRKDENGIMRDKKNRALEFDLMIRSESTMYQDTASIIRDELSKSGIKVNIRIVDFQKQVEQLFTSFDWDSTLIAFSGANIFPSQGSNTWPSSGNLHLWHPNQKTPATDWEARLDYLYNEGKFTINNEKAQMIWDEFQQIILDELPMIHLMRSRGFWAVNNRWDLTNVYFDNLNSSMTNFIYIK